MKLINHNIEILGNIIAAMMVGVENSNAIFKNIDSDIVLECINSNNDIEANKNQFWILLLNCYEQQIENENSFDLLKDTYLEFVLLIKEAEKCRIHFTIQKMKEKLVTCSNVTDIQAVKTAVEKNSYLFQELEDSASNSDSDNDSVD